MAGELFFIFEDGITAKDIKRFMNKQKKKLEKNVIKQEGNTTKGTRKRKNNNNLITTSPTKLIKSQTEKQQKNDKDIVINMTSSGTSKCCCDFDSDSGVDIQCNHCPEKRRRLNLNDTFSKPPNTNKLNVNQIETCKLGNCNGKKSTKRLDRLRRKQFKEKFQKYLSQTNEIVDGAYNELQNGDSDIKNVFLQSLTQENIRTINKNKEFVTNCNKPSSTASSDSCDGANGNCPSIDNISHLNELSIDKNEAQLYFELPEDECDDRSMVLHSTDETNNLNITNVSETSCKCHSNFGQPPSAFVALDCEFVGVGSRKTNALGRCSIVDYNGSIIYDEYCRPDSPITDYRTKWSGIRRKHMKHALPFDIVQEKIISLIKDKVVVGHALFNDFKVLQYEHPACMIRDTSAYLPLRQKAGLSDKQKISLKNLSKTLLGIDIQRKEHCSVEDSQAAMRLYKLVQFPWEQDVADQHNQAKSDTQKIQEKFPLSSFQKMEQKNQIKDICHKVKVYEDLQSNESIVNNSYLDDEFWPCDLFEGKE